MTRLLRGSFVVMLVLSILAPASGAFAQTPERIVAQAVAQLRRQAEQSREAVQEAVGQVNGTLVRNDRAGATDEQLTAAADRGKARVRQIGERALTAISTKLDRTLAALREAGGTERQAQAIRTAAANASAAVRAAVARGQDSIQRMLERLLG